MVNESNNNIICGVLDEAASGVSSIAVGGCMGFATAFPDISLTQAVKEEAVIRLLKDNPRMFLPGMGGC